MDKLKGPISRMGGKSVIAKQLVANFPPPETYNIYVEPFFGAGHVFYAKPKYKQQIEVINDLDDDMFKIMTGLQKEGNNINKTIYRHPLNREEWKSLIGKKDTQSLLLSYKNSFFGMNKGYDPSQLKRLHALNKTDYSLYQERLKGVKIYHKDYKTIINQYDSKNTFFYLDPPYENSKDYTNSINPQDLFNILQQIQGNFMLSYNDSSLIRSLFKNFNIYEIKTRYSQTGYISNRNIYELVITNY